MIVLTINGRRQELDEPTYLLDFLHANAVNVQFIAVAHNGEVLSKESFSQIILNDGDDLELVRPVGGG